MGWKDAPLVGGGPAPNAAGSWRDAPVVGSANETAEPDQNLYFDVPTFPGGPSISAENYNPATTMGKVNIGLAGATGAGMLGMALGPAGIVSAAKSAATGVIGAGLGGHAGRYIGSGIGFPEAGETIGRLAGGLAGGVNPRSLLTLIKSGHGLVPTLGRALIGGAETAAPAAAEAIAPAAAQAAAEMAPAASKVVASTVGLAKDKVWTVMDRAGQALRVFTNPHEAAQFASTAKNVASVVKTAAPAVTEAVEAAPTVTRAVQTVAQAAPKAGGNFAALQRFAKEAAMRGTKLGDKIWLELDEAGNPIRLLENSDKAGALKRAGGNTTWVKNIWS